MKSSSKKTKAELLIEIKNLSKRIEELEKAFSHVTSIDSGGTPRDSILTFGEEKRRSHRVIINLAQSSVTAEEINSFVNDSLTQIGSFAGISRVYIFEYDYLTNTMANTYEWIAPGISSRLIIYQNIDCAGIPWLMDQMLNNRIVNISDIEEIPELVIKNACKRDNIKSLLMVPLYIGEIYWGFIGFDECMHTRTWSNLDIGLLKAVAQLILIKIQHFRTIDSLMSSIARYLRIFETARDLMIIFDSQTGQIQAVNPIAQKVLGFSQDEMIHKDVSEFLAPPESGEPILDFKSLLSIENVQLNLPFRRQDGTTIEMEVVFTPDEYGGKTQVLAIARDITERKKAEQDKLNMQEQLYHAQKMEAIGALAGGVSHDFNNIIMGILGYVKLCLSPKIDSHQLSESLKIILELAERAHNINKELLTFARKTEPKIQPMDVAKLISKVRSLVTMSISNKIILQIKLAPNLPTVPADENQIYQILMNLCMNATDAMPYGGALTVEAYPVYLDENDAKRNIDAIPGNYMVLKVQDTGIGIPLEIKKRIFEPFYSTKGDRGTGLGLSISYGIVKAHNGFMEVESELGKGSVFKIFLPILPRPDQLQIGFINGRPSGGTETILIIEGEPHLMSLLQKVLSQNGYQVLAASHGRQGMELLKSNSVHLILFDLTMAIGNDYEIIKNFHAVSPETKIVITTGYVSISDNTFFQHQGVRGFLAKPFNIDECLLTIRNVLDSK